MSEQLQTMAGHVKSLPAERLNQIGIQFIEKMAIERRRQVAQLAGFQAAKMVMRLAAAIIAGRAAGVREFVGQPRIDEGFQSLVDRS